MTLVKECIGSPYEDCNRPATTLVGNQFINIRRSYKGLNNPAFQAGQCGFESRPSDQF